LSIFARVRMFCLKMRVPAGMMVFPMREIFVSHGRARKIGLCVAGGFLVLCAVIFFGNRYEWFAGRYLLLTTLDEPGGLKVSSPVYYHGARIGRVVWIRGPEEDGQDYKLRMRVNRKPFRRIALDARVRVDVSPKTGFSYVTILPGREGPDRYFPGKVKVLKPVSKGEQWFRMIYDILEGLEGLSTARIKEADIEELKAEVGRLQKKIEELEAKQNGAGSENREDP
jgi:ABC-type transporter Mla subunit MlaD